MLFSPSTQYAILALSYLATLDEQKPMTVTEIAVEAGVPGKFLAKILATLKSHRLVKAVKGPGGGYYLNKSPEELRLIDILRAIDPTELLDPQCVLGLDDCSDKHPCPLHFEWKKFKVEIEQKFHLLTVHELSEKLKAKRAHLKT